MIKLPGMISRIDYFTQIFFSRVSLGLEDKLFIKNCALGPLTVMGRSSYCAFSLEKSLYALIGICIYHQCVSVSGNWFIAVVMVTRKI